MRSYLSIIGAVGLVLAQPLAATPADDYEALRDEIWEWTLDNNPTLATQVGDRRGDGRIGDLSLAGFERDAAEQRAFLARLEAIDETGLPTDLRTDYGVLRRGLADAIEAAEYDQNRYTIFTNRGG
jgi:uncharacterized protein (DUF885 family)